MKKIAIIICLIVLTLFMSAHAAEKRTASPSNSGWHTVGEIQVDVDSSHFIKVWLNGDTNPDCWYYRDADAQEIALYNSVLLTALSTGREVLIYQDGMTKDRHRQIGSIKIR